MKKLFAMCLVCALTVAASASAGEKKAGGLTIQVIPMSTASSYWLAMKQGAEDAAKKYGPDYGGIRVLYDGPKENGDAATQINILNNAVTAKVDGVVLASTNPEALLQPVVDAIAAGVRVVTADSGVEPNRADSFLATNNFAACKMLGEYMGNLMGGQGKYAVVGDSNAFTSGRDRPAGFDAGMAKYPGIASVGTQLANSDINKAESITINYLIANPDLKLVFASNDRGCVGATNAFLQEGIKGDIMLCAVDVSLDTLKNMKRGVIQATILQRPYDMGYNGVRSILTILDGGTVEKEVDTGVFLLTPENMDSPEGMAAIRQYIADYDPAQVR